MNFDGVNIIMAVKTKLPNLSYGIAAGSHHIQKDSKIFIPRLASKNIVPELWGIYYMLEKHIVRLEKRDSSD